MNIAERRRVRRLQAFVAIASAIVTHDAASAGDFKPPRMHLPADGFDECRATAKADQAIPDDVDVTVFLKAQGDLHPFGMPFAPTPKLQKLVRCVVKKIDFETATRGDRTIPIRVVVHLSFGAVEGREPHTIGVLKVGPLTSAEGYVRRTGNLLDCYPVDARITGGFKRVLVPAIIGPDGSVSDLTIAPDNPAWAEGSARCLVDSMDFLPRTVDGEAIRTEFTLPIAFQGDDASSPGLAKLVPPTLGSNLAELNSAAAACYPADLQAAADIPFRFVISESGSVSEAVLVKGSGNARLDTTGLCVLRRLRFTPMVQDGSKIFPIVTWTVPVRPPSK